MNSFKVFFASLGCDKNLVDSEFMLGALKKEGYELTDVEEEADIIVINTCCFIHDAKEESIMTILSMAEYKEKGKLKVLAVTGCLAERYKEEIINEIPEVDVIVGTTATEKLVTAISDALTKKSKEKYFENIDYLPVINSRRVNTTGGYYSYIKIAEGCNKHCTYCIIPSLRGSYRSVPMETLIEEAKFLAEGGTKELIIVAQETTLYGVDLYGKKCLPQLLREFCKIDGIEWIRVLYCYPEEINDELIEVMKTEKKICHYLDMPIQHASDAVLKRMGRRTDKAFLLGLIERLRREIPDIALRTSLITGFPGETEEDIKELADFVEKVRFDRLGVFTYSKEENTPAAKMKGQVPQRVKKKRQNEIMALQQKISKENGQKMIGRIIDVIIEGRVTEDNILVGRTYKDAPGVDGYVFIDSERDIMSGTVIKVKITEAKEYDLVGKIID